MHFGNHYAALLLPFAHATTLSYDAGYSDSSRSLSVVACSNGPNGLITRFGWTRQSQIPRFPYIGGSGDIKSWNSPSCGTCYSVKYAPTGRTIFVLGIDVAASGLNVATEAMDDVTNGNAVMLGRIEVQTSKVDFRKCGLPHA